MREHVLSVVLLFCSSVALFAQGDKITRGPYLQLGTPNSIIVRWRTAGTNTSVVYYGLRAEKLDQKTKSAGILAEHVVLLSELTPATKYFYTIGTTNGPLPGASTNSFVTSPESGTRKPIRVWVIGDPGTQFPQQRKVRDAYYKWTGKRHTDLWLMLGDNAYSFGRDSEYQGAIFDTYGKMLSQSVAWPTLGNHDARSADSKTQSGVYYDIFSLPTQGQAGGVMSGTEAYYSYNYGNVHFVCFNSCDIDRSPNGEMLKWLRIDLAANKLDWTVAYFHHPPYTKGSHTSDDVKGENTDLTEIRENVIPILEQGGTDLVLCGHSHDYERTPLLDGHYGRSNTLTDAHKKNKGNGQEDGDGPYRKPTLGPAPHEGTVYVVAGSSGKISGGELNHPAMCFSTNSLGSLVLDFNGPRMDATFLSEKAEKLDHFTIVKGEK
ncbi:MAG: uncharacterized protein JWM68_794 [Verrucomicrobiales bacterium]|nr:uncharacterized protein [Verrucomicrobiales bacterium]